MPGRAGFVLFAEMRTGSNALEESLNLLPGVTCHGEAFNPHFIGRHDRQAAFGYDLARRAADPLGFLAALQAGTEGLAGFRFFHDHDPRVLEAVLPDPAWAKILLTRNPLEAYVSRRIAAATGQWRLTDMKDRKAAKARFDAAEFEETLRRQQEFRLAVMRALQVTGQTPFHIGYEQIGDVAVLNGLAAFLGLDARLERPAGRLKPQNPGALADKVENPAEMEAALARMDLFDLHRVPSLEPARGPAAPASMAAPESPLLFQPLKGGPTDAVARWLAALDGVGVEGLARGFTVKDLRAWKAARPGARGFTVASHPVTRAHRVFCRHILATGPGSFAAIRRALRESYGLPLPAGAPGPDWDAARHRAAFLGFLRWAKGNLAGQTGLRTDPAWASQAALLQGLAEGIAPDMVLREESLEMGLAQLARQTGLARIPRPGAEPPDSPHPLSAIHDREVEAAVRALHPRDYAAFAYGDWPG